MGDFEKYCICDNCEFRNIVLKYLGDEEIEELCRNKTERYYKKGEIIFHEGERITGFRYLKSGLVKLYRRIRYDEEQIITFIRAFEFVNNLAVFEGGHYKYSVSALEESVICSVNIDILRRLLLNNGGLAAGLLTGMAHFNDKIITHFLEIRRRNLTGRVAYVLLYFAREIYNSQLFDLPVSRKEIADYIGMSTANVIRTISDFKHNGIIKIYGKTIEIADINKLEIFSEKG
ncbi:MAG: Crp/Fnr family transcriptional regulator [Bacteroidales bacterium]